MPSESALLAQLKIAWGQGCPLDCVTAPILDYQTCHYTHSPLFSHTETCLEESVDKLFSQTLTAIVTSFTHQLSLALRAELNPGVEYGDSNANSSRQWLQMVGKKGVLVHLEGTMLPKTVRELRGR